MSLTTEERGAIVSLYESRFAELGADVRSLGWRDATDQRIRFDVLCDIGDLTGASVCDIGCGLGDLYPYLRERFGSVRYVGVDICPSFVRVAAERHPDCRFVCADILPDPFTERFDYFLLSGALNYKVADNVALSRAMLRKMWSLADRGVAVNFLTSYVNFVRPHNYHHSPEETFAFGRSLTPWVALRHDYPLWEFTLHLLREPRGRREPGGSTPDAPRT